MTNNNVLINELFEAGSHLGHKTDRIHPRAKKYIYKIENGVSIIDLTKTEDLMQKATKFVEDVGKAKKVLLVVVTKKIASFVVKNLCQENNITYVTVKWPAGLLTNFSMIIKNVKKLIDMKESRDKGEWSKFVKHEQMQMHKEIIRLERFYGGLTNLKKLPDALFVVDMKKEKNAVKEARELKIPIIAIADTNVDPDTVDYPIPANDDLLTSIEYITNKIIKAYIGAQK